ncbi:hypothetical protein OIO90_006436 [Microbotryomycetes sp. JL221]|nr:hypothetical protein OIO90_006436 [Microbotryomycetes sp. JL221]
MFNPYMPYTYAASPCHLSGAPTSFRRPAFARPAYHQSPFMTGSAYDSDEGADDEYEAYDLYRRQLEQAALAERQRQRRHQEEALLRRQLAIEREQERQRQLSAYHAVLEQQKALEHRERQRVKAIQDAKWRAQREAAVRQQRQRQLALEEEALRRRKLVEEAERCRAIDAPQDQGLPDNAEGHPFEPFWQLLFGSPSSVPRQKSTSSVCSSEPFSTDTNKPPAGQISEQASKKGFEPQSSAAPIASADVLPQKSEMASNAEDHTAHSAEEDDASSAESDNAATVLQRHYRTHLHRRQALSSLAALAASLDAQREAFKMPEQLTFQPSPPASRVSNGDDEDQSATMPRSTPKLAFSSHNAPFLAYEDALVGLLSKIDAVSTGGDRTVKKTRKDLVKKINSELDMLDSARESAWLQQQKQSQTEPTSEPAEEQNEPHSEPAEQVQEQQVDAPLRPQDVQQQAIVEHTEQQREGGTTREEETDNHAIGDADGHESDASTDTTLSVDDTEDFDSILTTARKLGDKVSELEAREQNEGFVVV